MQLLRCPSSSIIRMLLLSLLVFSASLVRAFTIPHHTIEPHHHDPLPLSLHAKRREVGLNQCGFPGNSDVYGLGVRVGIYLQWIAAIISCQFREESMRDVQTADFIFLIAIGVATLVLSVDPSTHAVEIMILLCIFFGDIFTVFLQTPGTRMRKKPRADSYFQVSIVGKFLRFNLICAMSVFAAFFCFRRIYALRRTSCDSVFLFAKLDLFGNALIFFKIIAVLNLVRWSWRWGWYVCFNGLFVVVPAISSVVRFPFLNEYRSDTAPDMELYKRRSYRVAILKWLASSEGEMPEPEVMTYLGFEATWVPDEDDDRAGGKIEPQSRGQRLRKQLRHLSMYVG